MKDIDKLCLVSSKLNNICGDERSEANDLVINAKPDYLALV